MHLFLDAHFSFPSSSSLSPLFHEVTLGQRFKAEATEFIDLACPTVRSNGLLLAVISLSPSFCSMFRPIALFSRHGEISTKLHLLTRTFRDIRATFPPIFFLFLNRYISLKKDILQGNPVGWPSSVAICLLCSIRFILLQESLVVLADDHQLSAISF